MPAEIRVAMGWSSEASAPPEIQLSSPRRQGSGKPGTAEASEMTITFQVKVAKTPAGSSMLIEAMRSGACTATQGAHGPLDTLRRVLLAMVDLGAAAPVLLLAGHAFLARSAADPDVRELYRDGGAAIHRAIVALVVAAQPHQAEAADIDPDAEARVLLGLASSLADGVLVGTVSPETATSTLDYYFNRIWPRAGSPAPDREAIDPILDGT